MIILEEFKVIGKLGISCWTAALYLGLEADKVN